MEIRPTAILSRNEAAMERLARWQIRVMVLALVLMATSTTSGQVGRPEGLYYKSWGLVIGIDDYLVAPKLSGSVADARVVADALRDLKFEEVIELNDKDASLRRLNTVLDDYLPRKVGRQDPVVIFFSGHAGATQDMHSKELGDLVPWDAQVTNASKAGTMDHLKDFSRRGIDKTVLFFFESGGSGRGAPPPQSPSAGGGVSPEGGNEQLMDQVHLA